MVERVVHPRRPAQYPKIFARRLADYGVFIVWTNIENPVITIEGPEKRHLQLIDAYLQDHALATLFDTTITDAMHRVGDLWFNGTITIADEHLATRVMLNALPKLRGIVVPGQATGLKAVCCGIEGDLHELPIHLAEIIFESEG